MYKRFTLWVCLALIFCLAPALAQAQTAPGFDLNRILRATVLVMQVRTTSNTSYVTCVSSGTIVTRTGLILTNAHSTIPNPDCVGDTLLIALNVREGEPPVPSYQAEVVQADLGLDIALLRVNAEINGRAVVNENIDLPFVELAEGSSLNLDDTITVVGYPGLSGEDAATAVSATVQGFTGEPRGGERAWVKFRSVSDTLAEVPGVFSGGGAYNREGLLVGIPTTAPLARQASATACARFQDTNLDGLVNTSDLCVPLGGAINALRPSDFALPLIRSASLGIDVTLPSAQNTALTATGLEPRVANLFFAPSANNDMPTTVISSLPSGSSSLYLFFDYEFMTPETIYELRVTIDGSTSAIFSLPPVRWSGGERGLWYIGLTGQALPNGEYNFQLLVNGVNAGEAPPLRVGGGPEPLPTFRNIQFVLREGEQIFGNGYILGVGPIVDAQFIYDNMTAGLEWTAIWYFGGQEIARVSETWALGTNGAQTTSVSDPVGLLPGRYRLALYIQGRLSSLADFTIAGGRADARPRVFTNERFVVASNISDALTARTSTSVTTPPESIFALFDWEQIAPGTLWQLRLTVDNEVFFDQTASWSQGENGAGFSIQISSDEAIPDGTYTMQLLMNNISLRTTTISVGIGQLPIDPFAEPEGVQLRGVLIDGDTGLGIPNATIFILSEAFSVVDFVYNTNQLYTLTTTDRDGRFQFSRPLRFTVPYSVIISVDGYLPINADGVEVDQETPNPLDITIYMTKG